MRQTHAMPTEHVEDRLGCTDCERIRDGAIAQPVNTATSAAFVAAAVVVAARAGRASDRRGEQAAFSGLLALVGAGSIAFHGPQPPGAKAMHDWPIVGLLALAVATPVVRAARGRAALPGWSRRRGMALALTSAAAAAAWVGGRTGSPACDPDSPVQLHGCWHVLAAAGFLQAAGALYDSTGGR